MSDRVNERGGTTPENGSAVVGHWRGPRWWSMPWWWWVGIVIGLVMIVLGVTFAVAQSPEDFPEPRIERMEQGQATFEQWPLMEDIKRRSCIARGGVFGITMHFAAQTVYWHCSPTGMAPPPAHVEPTLPKFTDPGTKPFGA